MFHDRHRFRAYRSKQENKTQFFVKGPSDGKVPNAQAYMIDSRDLFHDNSLASLGKVRTYQKGARFILKGVRFIFAQFDAFFTRPAASAAVFCQHWSLAGHP
jgi:hypothetical protein